MKLQPRKTEIEAVMRQLQILNRSLRLKQSLLRSIVSGFGTAIGAGLLVTLIAIVLEQLTGLPLLGQFFTFLAEHISGRR